MARLGQTCRYQCDGLRGSCADQDAQVAPMFRIGGSGATCEKLKDGRTRVEESKVKIKRREKMGKEDVEGRE